MSDKKDLWISEEEDQVMSRDEFSAWICDHIDKGNTYFWGSAELAELGLEFENSVGCPEELADIPFTKRMLLVELAFKFLLGKQKDNMKEGRSGFDEQFGDAGGRPF